MTIYSIGHSTRDLAEFTAALQAHQIELLCDVRAFPASRRYPHFSREELEMWLPEVGTAYRWFPELGGRRKRSLDQSPNSALRNPSFRNYADYMMSTEFARAIEKLLQAAAVQRTAIMCAERMYFQCHRMLISDYLMAAGHEVLHILDRTPPKPHRLTPEARWTDGKLVYSVQGDFQFGSG